MGRPTAPLLPAALAPEFFSSSISGLGKNLWVYVPNYPRTGTSGIRVLSDTPATLNPTQVKGKEDSALTPPGLDPPGGGAPSQLVYPGKSSERLGIFCPFQVLLLPETWRGEDVAILTMCAGLV